MKMVVPKLADRHVNAPAWSKSQFLFPFTSRVEATGRTIPKAQDHETKKSKRWCRSFEPRFLAPGWGGVSFLPFSMDRAHSLTGAKTNPGGLRSGLSSLPQFTNPATLRPQGVAKRTHCRVRPSWFPFPEGLSPLSLTSVPRDFSMMPNSPGAGSHIALAADRECAHWLLRLSCGPITP